MMEEMVVINIYKYKEGGVTNVVHHCGLIYISHSHGKTGIHIPLSHSSTTNNDDKPACLPHNEDDGHAICELIN
jgi:hypothetical protein